MKTGIVALVLLTLLAPFPASAAQVVCASQTTDSAADVAQAVDRVTDELNRQVRTKNQVSDLRVSTDLTSTNKLTVVVCVLVKD